MFKIFRHGFNYGEFPSSGYINIDSHAFFNLNRVCKIGTPNASVPDLPDAGNSPASRYFTLHPIMNNLWVSERRSECVISIDLTLA